MAEMYWPWKMAAIGMGLVLVTALVGGFALGYWTGGKPGPPAAPPSPNGDAVSAPSRAVPAPSPPPKAAAAPPAASPPKVVAAPSAPAAPATPAPAPVRRPSVEPAPAPASKPRTVPTAADIDACSRYAFAQTEGQDKTGEDDQDRKDDGSYRAAYASCLQSRGFKKPRGDD